MMRVCVVGLGLIGGSLARALRSHGVAPTAIDSDETTVAAARRDGIRAERADDGGRRAAIADAEAIVLGVPIARLSDAANAIASLVGPDTIMLHAASLQRADALGMAGTLATRVIGAHPVAGTHAMGYAASSAHLFEGATVSIEARADQSVRGAAESIWRAAGASRFVYRSAGEHDALMAWISHLPQLASTALATVLSRAAIDPADGGPGARDATRLAGSPYEMWEGILDSASPETLRALDAVIGCMSELRSAIAERNHDALASLWTPARHWAAAQQRAR